VATIADLNVRLGVINDLTKGLNKMERDLQKSGQKLAQIGQNISLSIGLPLGLIGKQALQTAGQFEAFELALTSQLGSAKLAREELEKLRISALAPGLGFEQAVKGSVQLQAVGLSADKARRTIEAFGNGLALAGKGGEELDGVLLALTQISAKGVVSAEEINQIAERLPQIRTLMQQAFGTASTEAIQKLGITSEVFIDKITEQLEKLPKATGGIKNSFDNLRDSVNQSLAKIGFAINDAFDVAGIAESLGKAVNTAAKAFDNLSDSSKQFVIIIAGAAIAIGPLLAGIGSLKLLGGLAAGGLLSITNGLGRMVTGITLATRAFQALTIAQRAFFLGAAVLLVVGLVQAYTNYAASVKGATEAQKALNKVNETAEESIVTQRLESERLTKVIENENSTYAQKRKALDKLVEIAPDYYGTLDKTAISTDKVRDATNKYISALRLTAKIEAAKDELVEYEKSLLRVAKNSDPSIGQQLVNFFKAGGNAAIVAALNAKDYGENVVENTKNINDASTALEAYIAELEKGQTVAAKGDGTYKPPGPTAEQLAAAKKRAEAYADALASINAVALKGDVLGANVIKEQATEIRSQIEKLIELGFDPYGKEIDILKQKLIDLTAIPKETVKAFKDLQKTLEDGPAPDIAPQPDLQRKPAQEVVGGLPFIDPSAVAAGTDAVTQSAETIEQAGFSIAGTMAKIREGTLSAQDGFRILAENMSFASETTRQAVELLASGVQGVFDGIGAALGSGASSFAEFAKSALSSIADVIGGLIKLYIAELLQSSAAFAVNPFVALAIGGAVAALGTGLFNRLIGNIKTPKLAKGGLAFGPTTAIVGDNPGARSNPEVIAPLDKLKSFINPNGGGGEIVGEYVVRGQDLLVVLKRAEVSNQRLTGKR